MEDRDETNMMPIVVDRRDIEAIKVGLMAVIARGSDGDTYLTAAFDAAKRELRAELASAGQQRPRHWSVKADDYAPPRRYLGGPPRGRKDP